MLSRASRIVRAESAQYANLHAHCMGNSFLTFIIHRICVKVLVWRFGMPLRSREYNIMGKKLGLQSSPLLSVWELDIPINGVSIKNPNNSRMGGLGFKSS